MDCRWKYKRCIVDVIWIVDGNTKDEERKERYKLQGTKSIQNEKFKLGNKFNKNDGRRHIWDTV